LRTISTSASALIAVMAVSMGLATDVSTEWIMESRARKGEAMLAQAGSRADALIDLWDWPRRLGERDATLPLLRHPDPPADAL
jgi:hypothetical protein